MKAWLSVTALLIVGLLTPSASATIQQRDTIAIDGKIEEMRVYPLQPWLEEHPGALPESEILSTNRFRGYVAHWMLVDGRLELARVDVAFEGPTTAWSVTPIKLDKQDRSPTLADVESRITTIRPIDVADVESIAISMPIDRDVRSTLFPGHARVVADWYSGTLVIPQGPMLDTLGFADSVLYAHYLLVIVEQGREVQRLRLDAMQYDTYRHARFRSYQQTSAYAAAIRELAEYGWAREDAMANVYSDRLEEYISLEPMEGR